MERKTKPLDKNNRVALDFCAKTPLMEKRRCVERFIWKLLDAVKKPSPTILEANCTDGWDTEIFLQRGAHIAAVCSSEKHLDFAQRRAPDAEFHLTSIDFEPETFDAIWCINVLDSLKPSAASKICTDFARILKPKGLLAFNCKTEIEEMLLVLQEKFEIIFREEYPEDFFPEKTVQITARKR
ncbi:class I SAM-dependent methyltransferase [bacterium]|nr:class I SAM-dependent methyltransferase [bacterium]